MKPIRETTRKRYKRIYKRYQELLGTDTVMNIYYKLADELGMSIDRIRQIIAICRHNWWFSLTLSFPNPLSLHSISEAGSF